MFIYYLTPEKKSLYKLKGDTLFLSSLKALKNPFNLFQKKVLLLGKELVYFLKKRYPLLPEKELKKAIFYEVSDLFPLKEPSFIYQIGKKGETFVEVNIFAWEKSFESELKEFKYVVLEELLFLFEDLTLSILNKGKTSLFVLSRNKKFLNSLLVKNPFALEDVVTFLKSAGFDVKDLQSVYCFGFSQNEILSLLPQDLKPKVYLKGSLEKELPHLLKALNLKSFKIKREFVFNFEEFLLSCARLFLMIVIALQLNLLFSYWEYDRSVKEVSSQLKKVDEFVKEKLPSFQKGGLSTKEDEERIQALKELKEELSAHKANSVSDGLFLLTEVAGLLPDGSRLSYFSLKEKKLSLSLESKNFFETLTNFRKSSFCKDLKLPSAPIFDSRKKTYRFTLECELK